MIPDDLAALQNIRKMTGKYLVVSTSQGRMRNFETVVGHVRNYARGELVKKLEMSDFVGCGMGISSLVVLYGISWNSQKAKGRSVNRRGAEAA
jgi:hypothetical protein